MFHKRWPVTGLLIVVLLVVWETPVMGQRSQEYKPGQKVDVKIRREWFPARIDLLTQGGWYSVWFLDKNGDLKPSTVKPENVRPAQIEPGYPDTFYFSNQPVRQWTRNNGELFMEGALVSITGNHVSIRLEENIGSRARNRSRGTNLRSLSKADRDYVASQEKLKADELNNAGSALAVKMKPPQEIKFADRVISLGTGGWAFEPATVRSTAQMASTSIGLRHGILTAGPRGRRRSRPRPGDRGPGGRPEGIGTPSNAHFTKPEFKQLSRSSDGKQLAILMTDPFTNCSFVDSVTLSADRHQQAEMEAMGLGIDAESRSIIRLANNAKVTSRRAGKFNSVEAISEKTGNIYYASLDKFGSRDPGVALFLNESLVIVIGEFLTAIDLEKGRAYRTEALPGFFSKAAVSPDKNHIAVGVTSGVFIFNVARGRMVGMIKTSTSGSQNMAFSPDGNRLAVMSAGSQIIQVFDLSSGNETTSFRASNSLLPTAGSTSGLAWPVDRFLVVDNREIVDVKNKLPVWQLSTGVVDRFQHLGGSDFWYSFGIRGCVFSLPTQEIANRLDRVSIDDSTVLKSGDSVAIKFDDNGMLGKQASKVEENLRKSFEDRGIRIDPRSNSVLIVGAEPLPVETITVRDRRGEPNSNGEYPTFDVQVRPSVSKMQLKHNGRVIWQRERENRPTSVLRGPSARADAQKQCRPQSSFYKLAFGDRLVVFPGGEIFLGSSKITADGIENQ